MHTAEGKADTVGTLAVRSSGLSLVHLSRSPSTVPNTERTRLQQIAQ